MTPDEPVSTGRHHGSGSVEPWWWCVPAFGSGVQTGGVGKKAGGKLRVAGQHKKPSRGGNAKCRGKHNQE